MRSEKVMKDLILTKAMNDDRIQACFLNGSRADVNATHDKYCDYDIVYVVNDIRSFTNDIEWINYFGDMLILQKPEDWYNHPYDYNGTARFSYLMQFIDGTRVDLTLVDVTHISSINIEKEPRIILLDKDKREELYDVQVGDIYNIQKPTYKEYLDTCNEFWWLAVNVAKGICREEFVFVKTYMEQYEMNMLLKMLSWKIGIDNDFNVSVGKCYKYLKRYLSEDDMKRVMNLYPSCNYQDIKEKLINMLDYFQELSREVADYFDFKYNEEEANMREFVIRMLGENLNT